MVPAVQKGNLVYLNVGTDRYVYDLTRPPLGSGAMGVVHLGNNCANGEKVAIKQVRSQFAHNPNVRKRAQLEASHMFSHKNLIEIRGICAIPKGPIFIISKLVQGQDIRTFISKFEYSKDRVKKVCDIFYSVLDALDFLHSKDVLHLDIKPSNIMIEGGHNVRLMDLGIASSADDTINKFASFIGTPKYAAPEQIRDKSDTTEELSVRTDIYQAGLTLYELLTGMNPYDSKSVDFTLEMHLKVDIPESDRIPKKLYKVLRKATSRYPIERYASVNEFRAGIMEAMKASFFEKLFSK